LALAALALMVFGAYDSYPILLQMDGTEEVENFLSVDMRYDNCFVDAIRICVWHCVGGFGWRELLAVSKESRKTRQ